MALLIDGYNLLHATGLVGRAGSGLQGSREALLRFLATAIEPKELSETTVVFDAAEAPPGLPRTVSHESMTVRYASDYEDADALIEELIASNNVPRSLTVVTSDHRLQRAARRRRATFVDSDVWFAEAVRRRRTSRSTASAVSRNAVLDADEIKYWLDEFGMTSAQDALRPRVRGEGRDPELESPFPPGYAEDLGEDF